MSNPMNASDIANSAVAVGTISKAAGAAASQAVQLAAPDTGIDAKTLGSARVFLLNVIVDDSGSMSNFVAAVVSALNKLYMELKEAAEEADIEILISVTFLNRGQIQSYERMGEARELTEADYAPNGGTPLYSTINSVLGTMLVKVSELTSAGRTAQSFTCVISDGQPTDGDSTSPDGDGVSTPAQVANLIGGFLAAKQHIVCGVSIGSAANPFFASIGIPSKWIVDPARDPFAFESAIKQVSRASRSASKGAGAFAHTAQGGFQ